MLRFQLFFVNDSVTRLAGLHGELRILSKNSFMGWSKVENCSYSGQWNVESSLTHFGINSKHFKALPADDSPASLNFSMDKKMGNCWKSMLVQELVFRRYVEHN